MSRTAIRSSFPVSRASSSRRVRPAHLRLTGSLLPTAGALIASLIALAVVAAVTLGVPASPAWAAIPQTINCSTSGTFTVTDNVVSDGATCTGTAHIPATVTSIGVQAFKNSPLTLVTFAENSALLTILYQAFDGSGLTSIVIPKSVTLVGGFTFASTAALVSVTFEADSVLQTINEGAFTNMGLRSVVIPQSVTTIGNFAFKDNSLLTSVTFEGDRPTVFGTEVFANVANGATVTVGLTATGFEPVDSAGLWEGLFLVRAAAPSVPAAAPSGPVGPVLACMPEGPPVVGAPVTCTATGGDAGIDILWRAAYNPVIAETGVTLDASGSGVFSFTVPAAALGEELTVELVDWTAPMSLGTVGGPVPTSVPSGGGPVPVWTLGLLALAGGLTLRRGSRSGRWALSVG